MQSLRLLGQRIQRVLVGGQYAVRDGLDGGLYGGQGRSQLVGQVGEQTPAGLFGGRQSASHRVKGVGQPAELRADPRLGKAGLVVAVGDSVRRIASLGHRGGEPPCHQPGHHQGHHQGDGHPHRQGEEPCSSEGVVDGGVVLRGDWWPKFEQMHVEGRPGHQQYRDQHGASAGDDDEAHRGEESPSKTQGGSAWQICRSSHPGPMR